MSRTAPTPPTSLLGWRHALHGWSLIELLVAVAMILVLVALLLSGFTAIEQRVSLTVCQSNQRDLFNATTAFRVDHDGRVPPGQPRSYQKDENGDLLLDANGNPIMENRWPTNAAWRPMIAEYLDGPIPQCPGFLEGNSSSTGGYGLFQTVTLWQFPELIVREPFRNSGVWVTSINQVAMWAEANAQNYWANSQLSGAMRSAAKRPDYHGRGRTAILFCDGSSGVLDAGAATEAAVIAWYRENQKLVQRGPAPPFETF